MKKTETYYTGTKARVLLQSQGLRQSWVARQSGISDAHLSRIIRGERLASSGVAHRISAVLRVPLFLAFDLPEGSKTLRDGMHTPRKAA